MTKTHDDSVSRFDQLFREKGIRSQRSYPNEQLIQFVAGNWFALAPEQRREIRILEVGCGSGANLWMLAKEGFSVYGIDSSAAGIAIAESHLRDKWGVSASLECGSVVDLPYGNGFFDAVVDVVTLQHLNLEDSARALAEIRRVLKPGGQFFSYRASDRCSMFLNSGADFVDAVTVSNVANTAMPLHGNGPMSFWGPALVRQIYLAQGFEVESIERHARTYGNCSCTVEYLAITAKNSS
ncbi:MAG: putative S-adenosylmethionine-dependent methyltransferase [Betaproteobacteria bacterium ADurb.Bin341]|nr:MAG: putative S-adenosylmethionine-dependent methyltransferase [Betaproteobacteria bacterium ADurb.Bin341]